jgi:hypothetical protein
MKDDGDLWCLIAHALCGHDPIYAPAQVDVRQNDVRRGSCGREGGEDLDGGLSSAGRGHHDMPGTREDPSELQLDDQFVLHEQQSPRGRLGLAWQPVSTTAGLVALARCAGTS